VRRYLGEGPLGKVSCQPASRGSSPAVFILHIFSSANEQAAKETKLQERRAKRQRLGHCRNQSLLPSVPERTTNQFHYLKRLWEYRDNCAGPKKILSVAAITPSPYCRVDTLPTHFLPQTKKKKKHHLGSCKGPLLVLGRLPRACSR